jgi:protein MPE1
MPPQNVPDHEPPTGYICYRCGEKGHWIQVCPTNDDPNFDNKPRVKRTTGIPRSFLKTVEKPLALTSDGTADDTKAPSGVMVNAEGEFVIAEPDRASWEQFQAKTKSSAAAQKAAASGDKKLQGLGLECSIDKRIFIDPMKTPCCEKTYCNDCITNALIESDFTCPGCGTDEVLIDNLKPDEEMSLKIRAFIDEEDAAKREKDRSKSPYVNAENIQKTDSDPLASKEKRDSPPLLEPATVPQLLKSPSPETKSEKPVANGSSVVPTSPKKRPADDLLENLRIPKAPKAMQQQEAERQAQLQQQQALANSMSQMGGFPNMPNMGFDISSQQFSPNSFSMGMNGVSLMNGYGMGMHNMSMAPMMGTGTSMMNPMMGLNGFPMNGLMGMSMSPGVFGGMSYGATIGSLGMATTANGASGANGGNGAVTSGTGLNGSAGSFPNQQKTVFAAPMANEEDNAYFRKPVNPHRHQGRQRRARPSDYREL